MEATMEKKERKVIDFDDRQYTIEINGLENMAATARIFQDAWTSQPILKGMEFQLKHLHGIISHGSSYIINEIQKLIAANQEKTLPGLSMQMQSQEIKLYDVDQEKLNRYAVSITEKHPADRFVWVNHRMLDVIKGQVCITDETRAKVRERLTIFDDNKTLAEIYEIGNLCANSANLLLDIMKQRKEQKEKTSGFKLPNQSVELFAKHNPGLSEQSKGAMYYSEGKVFFNLKYFV